MAIEFDLSRALFLTYVGVGAAFLVLGSLVLFTGLIGWWGNWRWRKAQERAEEAANLVAAAAAEIASDSELVRADPQLAAAIGVAVALAVDAYRSERAGEDLRSSDDPGRDGGWREQGRIVAFDSRRLRERDR